MQSKFERDKAPVLQLFHEIIGLLPKKKHSEIIRIFSDNRIIISNFKTLFRIWHIGIQFRTQELERDERNKIKDRAVKAKLIWNSEKGEFARSLSRRWIE